VIDYQAAQFWANIAVLIVGSGASVYAWRVRRDMATIGKITEIEASISQHVAENGVQLAHLDERLRQAIGAAELKPIYDRLNSVSESISEINGKMHTLDLIHEMMLNEGRKP